MNMQKTLLLALLSLCSFAFITSSRNNEAPKQTYYYFCLSKEVPTKEDGTSKIQFVYTDIHEITGDETDIRRLTGQFTNFINKQCKAGNEMCTSDLNYYPDLQQAEKYHREIVKKYEGATQYTVKRIAFKFN